MRISKRYGLAFSTSISCVSKESLLVGLSFLLVKTIDFLINLGLLSTIEILSKVLLESSLRESTTS